MKKESSPPRFFTNEFKLGEEVCVIRSKHGWFDGNLSGTIVELFPRSCTVKDEDGGEHEINHPRDLRK